MFVVELSFIVVELGFIVVELGFIVIELGLIVIGLLLGFRVEVMRVVMLVIFVA